MTVIFFKGTFDGQDIRYIISTATEQEKTRLIRFWLCAGRRGKESECRGCGFERQWF